MDALIGNEEHVLTMDALLGNEEHVLSALASSDEPMMKQLLKYIEKQASFDDAKRQKTLKWYEEKGFFFIEEWMVPYTMRSKRSKICLWGNKPGGTCTWPYCKHTHKCMLCSQTSHGALELDENDNYKCGWLRDFYTALDRAQLSMTEVDHLVTWLKPRGGKLAKALQGVYRRQTKRDDTGSAVDYTGKEPERGTYNKVFIGGLARVTTKETMDSHFEKFGHIVDSVVMTEKGNPTLSRGFGFVTYAHVDSVDRVMAQAHHIDGREVECKRAVPRKDMRQAAKDVDDKEYIHTHNNNDVVVPSGPPTQPQPTLSHQHQRQQQRDDMLRFLHVTLQDPTLVLEVFTCFVQNEVDMLVMSIMREDDYSTMGLKVGVRVRIMDALRRQGLLHSTPPPTPSITELNKTTHIANNTMMNPTTYACTTFDRDHDHEQPLLSMFSHLHPHPSIPPLYTPSVSDTITVTSPPADTATAHAPVTIISPIIPMIGFGREQTQTNAQAYAYEHAQTHFLPVSGHSCWVMDPPTYTPPSTTSSTSSSSASVSPSLPPPLPLPLPLPSSSTPPFGLTSAAIAGELADLPTGGGICSVCTDNEANCLFQCGHVTCMRCGCKLTHCPVCTEPIVVRIRTYL